MSAILNYENSEVSHDHNSKEMNRLDSLRIKMDSCCFWEVSSDQPAANIQKRKAIYGDPYQATETALIAQFGRTGVDQTWSPVLDARLDKCVPTDRLDRSSETVWHSGPETLARLLSDGDSAIRADLNSPIWIVLDGWKHRAVQKQLELCIRVNLAQEHPIES